MTGTIDPASEAHANVSVFIMTLNEEINIGRCLDSVRWSNDVVVLDSLSRDRTVECALTYSNVRVFQRKFDSYSQQRNYGIHQIRYRNPWVLVLDADEVVEPALAGEMLAISRLASKVSLNAFALRRKVFIGGRWVRRNVSYDVWIERLIRPTAVRFEGAVHERARFDGTCGRLAGALEHHQFSKGTDHWLARRAKYARLAAEQPLPAFKVSQLARNLLIGDLLLRKAALKALFYRLPARYVFYLAYNLLFKFPFLDGVAGVRYVLLETYSQYLDVRQRMEVMHAHLSAASSTLDL